MHHEHLHYNVDLAFGFYVDGTVSLSLRVGIRVQGWGTSMAKCTKLLRE